MAKQHPVNEWIFDDNIELGFSDWFNGNAYQSQYPLSKWFYDDCNEFDEKQRMNVMYKWIHLAYFAGYVKGASQTKE